MQGLTGPTHGCARGESLRFLWLVRGTHHVCTGATSDTQRDVCAGATSDSHWDNLPKPIICKCSWGSMISTVFQNGSRYYSIPFYIETSNTHQFKYNMFGLYCVSTLPIDKFDLLYSIGPFIVTRSTATPEPNSVVSAADTQRTNFQSFRFIGQSTDCLISPFRYNIAFIATEGLRIIGLLI